MFGFTAYANEVNVLVNSEYAESRTLALVIYNAAIKSLKLDAKQEQEFDSAIARNFKYNAMSADYEGINVEVPFKVISDAIRVDTDVKVLDVLGTVLESHIHYNEAYPENEGNLAEVAQLALDLVNNKLKESKVIA